MNRAAMKISEIKIGHRHRKDPGDITSLAESIESIGLLHPIVVLPDGTLIAGGRRIAAFEALGLATIPATVLDDLGELDAVLRAERDENIQRLDLVPSEAVSMGLEIERLASEEAALDSSRAKSPMARPVGGATETLGLS